MLEAKELAASMSLETLRAVRGPGAGADVTGRLREWL